MALGSISGLDLGTQWAMVVVSALKMEIEDTGFMNQYDKKSKPYIFSADSFSSESNTETKRFVHESFRTPTSFIEQDEIKLPSFQNANNINRISPTTKRVASTTHSSSNTISFGDLKPKDDVLPSDDLLGYGAAGTGNAPTKSRSPDQSHSNLLAERKRRENMNRYFISLSAMLPNLKKMDKASVLGDAIDYIRKLQERVKELEGGTSGVKKDAKETIVVALNRPSHSNTNDNDSSSKETIAADHSMDTPCNSSVEIEVRMSGSSVLVRIQSLENSSLLVKAISKMQKLGLSIVSSSAFLFANTITVISIVAEVFFLNSNNDLVLYLNGSYDLVLKWLNCLVS
ncbi:hypothetical protein L2E82_18711 [Cichorium intybus]|uniref:Uncharacterized protein n=1 Tax=Cichorium intybus TaxID=13427 RepID=A0ACB9FBJ0_CICIN|nr:hypothetical protein L2E82_18711 [Cichorium intybus]